jgi:carboxypeptidase Taq
MSDRYAAFEARMHELKDLDGIIGLLSWDEETYAPPKARAGRGDQSGTIESIRHQRLVDPVLGDLIQDLEGAALDPIRRACVVRMKRQRDRAVNVPESLVKEIAKARSTGLGAWQKARSDNAFADFAPHLERMFELQRQKADALLPASRDRYDALLEDYEPGMTRRALEPVLEELRRGLVPLVSAIVESRRRPRKDFIVGRPFDVEAQWKLTIHLLRDLGFDFERGRQDRSAHPFTGGCSVDDVRVTTRIFDDNPLSAIFSTIHECGHGLYEQGFDAKMYRTTLAAAPSMGIHESQSRLWENIVGRSRPFWRHYLPILAKTFPEQLRGVTLDEMVAAVNDVEPSLIRVEADEVTYNLHILVRFELEVALLTKDLTVKDVPAAWNERMRKYLGITPPDDGSGCLQDIHWAWGAIGYFPTYSLGNLWSAQLMKAYEREHAAVWRDIEGGDFAPLLEWLREKIHARGYLGTAEETILGATGDRLKVGPFLDYLWSKYRELYALS